MRLLHVIGSMHPDSGGPCQGIRNSNVELKRFLVEREAVSLDDPQSSFLGMDDFPTHAMGPISTPWQYSSKLKPWLLENLPYFDVVIINGLWLYSSYAVWSAMRTLEKRSKVKGQATKLPKIFAMPHGMLDPYFQRAVSRRLKAIRNWIYWHLIEKHIVNDAEALLFTCERELQLARETFSFYHPKKEINVGYGVVAPPAYTPAMRDDFAAICPQLGNSNYWLFLSRIHPKKGLDNLLNAYKRLVEMQSASPVDLPKLVIAGPGKDTVFGKRLYNQVMATPVLKDKVVFTGMLNGNAKWGAMYGCEAFVLPSHQENFGIAVVEALACSKPVLITKEVNIFMEIEAGGGGLVSDDSEGGILQILVNWLNLAAAEKQTMGENAFVVFKQHFDIHKASTAFLKAISG